MCKNMTTKKLLLVAVLLAACWQAARADEGMWMIQDINEALEKNMRARGLQLSAGEIYDADAPGACVSDAVVSLGFSCTGSVISDHGLVITNHHCAYSHIAALSTAERNYLEEGFWAATLQDEIPLKGEKVYFLKKVVDVTGEARALARELAAKGERFGSRKLGALLEKKYAGQTGLEAVMSSMWAGEKRYMSLYKVYTDVRLVAAPPVCIGFFGGDEDNWEWPRHNCDFAIYRIYEDNSPVRCGAKLKISLAGYRPGSFAMVIGYPGRTDRYASSAEVDHRQRVILPVSNELCARRMEIMRKWMDADPGIRRKYADRFFGLSNAVENNIGTVQCYRRFGVKAEKEAQEAELQRWIDSADNRKEMWGDLLPGLKEAYSKIEAGEIGSVYYRETLLRGTGIAGYMLRAGNGKTVEDAIGILLDGLRETDPRVEKELLTQALRDYFTNLDSYYYSDFHLALQNRFGTGYPAMTEHLWRSSLISSEEKIRSLSSLEQLQRDPLVKLFDVSIVRRFNERNGHLAERNRVANLEREYEKALYWMNLHKDKLQYPDANSTMRITYGTVGGYSPRDALACSWYSTTSGILEKYDPLRHDFNLDEQQRRLLEKGDWGRWGSRRSGKKVMFVDFLTDNDITGGNSGSPVLNARGELIGLAFDGNKESLASDASYTAGYNKCINTDIRFVLWVLDKYAGMQRILDELEFTKR